MSAYPDLVVASTVPAQMAARAAKDPDADLIAIDGVWRTVGEVHEASRRLATGLYRFGVRPGDRLASIMTNRPEAVDLSLACAELGGIHVPLNVFLKGEFLRYQIADADASVLVVDAAGYEAASPLIHDNGMDTRLIALDDGAGDTPRLSDFYDEPNQQWPDPTPDSLLSILYTSGTTGLPKGCMINHGYSLHFPIAHYLNDWFKPGDTSISTLPLYHAFGISGFMDAIVVGCRINFESTFSASTLIRRAKEVGATQLWAVGAIGVAVLATPEGPGDREHSLERAIMLPMAPGVQRQFEERFGVTVVPEGYGQTEVLPATMSGPRKGRDRPSAGRRVPWLDVQVVDDHDRILPVGESGEIVVRPLEPYSIFSGYWRKEEATLEAWRNLWHHTGDLGYFDEDGILYFVDRKKDALRRRGENVASVELELAILKNPAVNAVAIHAVPSELGEDEIKAVIVLEPGQAPTPEELFAFFKENLPYYAVPRYYEFAASLPTNAMGRVMKHQLRAAWESDANVDFQALGLTVEKSERR